MELMLSQLSTKLELKLKLKLSLAIGKGCMELYYFGPPPPPPYQVENDQIVMEPILYD